MEKIYIYLGLGLGISIFHQFSMFFLISERQCALTGHDWRSQDLYFKTYCAYSAVLQLCTLNQPLLIVVPCLH